MEVMWQISGRVQRVGFRYWTIRAVSQIGNISGYVANTDDGNVIVYVRGPEENLQKLKNLLYQGPLFSRVDSIIPITSENVFFPPIVNGVFKKLLLG